MAGETWNTLVTVPTERELDAAMAEIRVRAIGHARRGARRGRAMRLVAMSTVLTIGVLAGRTLAAPHGLALYDDFTDVPGYSNFGTLRASVIEGPAAVATTSWRWHVTLRTTLEGIEVGRGEAWVEGPPERTGFQFVAQHMGAVFSGQFGVETRHDSMVVLTGGRYSRSLGYTREGRRVVEDASLGNVLKARIGDVIEILPFGGRDTAGALTVMRVEGPYTAQPAEPPVWRSNPEVVRSLTARASPADRAHLSGTPAAHQFLDPLLEAASHGVRYSESGGSLTVTGRWFAPGRGAAFLQR